MGTITTFDLDRFTRAAEEPGQTVPEVWDEQ